MYNVRILGVKGTGSGIGKSTGLLPICTRWGRGRHHFGAGALREIGRDKG